MKKTITIHLNQVIFNIEEDAYGALQKYFDGIKKHFAKTDDAEEIVSDIEASAADHFNKTIGKTKKVITLSDVQELIKSMGTVEDISAEDETDKNEVEEATSPKKLFRDTQNKILGGVSSGLAAYFGIDPVIIRLIFVATIAIPLFNGFGLLLYIILWFIMPEAKTTADRMAMRGEPVTLSNLEAAVSSKISPETKSGLSAVLSKITEFVVEISRALFRVFGKIFWIFLAFLGLVIIIASALGIAGTVSLLINLLVNSHLIASGLVVSDILPGHLFTLLLFFATVVVFVPLILLLQAGISLLRRKSAFGLGSSLILFFTWVIAVSGIVAMAINIAPKYQPQIQQFLNNNNSGLVFDGHSLTPALTTSKDYSYRNFDTINVSSAYRLTVKQGSHYQIEAFGTESQIERIRFNQTGKILTINHNISNRNCLFCGDHNPVRIEITTPVLNTLTASGATVTTLESIKSSKLNLNLSGASRLNISGSVDRLNISISGASNLNSLKTAVRNMTIDSSGASVANVAVSSSLEGKLSGSSRLYYLGKPKITTKNSGASIVEEIDPDQFYLTVKNGAVVDPVPAEIDSKE